MRRAAVVAAVVLGALCAGPAAVSAHPLLAGSSPQPGLVAPKSPDAVVIGLSEPAVASGSSISLDGPSGRIRLGSLRAVRGARTLTASVPQDLKPAVYTVQWRAFGADGHGVSGSYEFGVAGAGGAPPPGVEKLGAAGGGGRGSEDAAREGWLGIAARWVGLLGAALLFGGFLLARRAGLSAALNRVLPFAWG